MRTNQPVFWLRDQSATLPSWELSSGFNKVFVTRYSGATARVFHPILCYSSKDQNDPLWTLIRANLVALKRWTPQILEDFISPDGVIRAESLELPTVKDTKYT